LTPRLTTKSQGAGRDLCGGRWVVPGAGIDEQYRNRGGSLPTVLAPLPANWNPPSSSTLFLRLLSRGCPYCCYGNGLFPRSEAEVRLRSATWQESVGRIVRTPPGPEREPEYVYLFCTVCNSVQSIPDGKYLLLERTMRLSPSLWCSAGCKSTQAEIWHM